MLPRLLPLVFAVLEPPAELRLASVPVRADGACSGALFASGWVLAPRGALPERTNPALTAIGDGGGRAGTIAFLPEAPGVVLLMPDGLVPGALAASVADIAAGPLSGAAVCDGYARGEHRVLVGEIVHSTDDIAWLGLADRVSRFCGSCFLAETGQPLGVAAGGKGRALLVQRAAPLASALASSPWSAPAPAADDPLDGYFPPPKVYRYTSSILRGGAVQETDVTETWIALETDEGGNTRYRVERSDGAPQTWSVGPDGLRRVDPADASLFLPAHPRAGMSWADYPVSGGVARSRQCSIDLDHRFSCVGGLAAVCWESGPGDPVLYTRDTFCPGWGWRAHESVMFEGGQGVAWAFTRRVSRDDQEPMRDPNLLDHRFPAAPYGPLEWTLRGYGEEAGSL